MIWEEAEKPSTPEQSRGQLSTQLTVTGVPSTRKGEQVDLKEAFAATLSQLDFSPTCVELASQRYQAIKQTIEQALPGKTVSPIGSFQRQTTIRPPDGSDTLAIDLLVRCTTARWSLFGIPGVWQTPASALHQIQRVLVAEQTYSLTRPQAATPTVLLRYADQCTFQLVPALVDKTGRHQHRPGEPDCYLVGVTRHSWSPADYDYEAASLSSLDLLTGGRLVPAIKLIKAFLRGQGFSPDPLPSFHLELLCARILPPILVFWETYGLGWGYQQVLAYFLSNIGNQLASPVALPHSYSPPLQLNLSPADLYVLKNKVDLLGQAARRLCRLPETPDTCKRWREFFGDPFPV